MRRNILLVATCILLTASGCVTSTHSPRAVRAEAKFIGEYFETKQVDVAAKPIKRVQPKYPQEFRNAGIGGYAVVEFIVNSRGMPKDVQCVEASDQEFGNATVAAVAQWRFTPAEKAGQQVASRMQQRMDFSLNR